MTIKKTEDSVNSYADVLRFDRVRFLSEKGTVLSAIFTVTSAPSLRNSFPSPQCSSCFGLRTNSRLTSGYAGCFRTLFQNPKTELFRKLASKNIQTEGTFRHGPHLLNVLKQVSAKRRVVVCTRNMCDGMIVQVWAETSAVFLSSCLIGYPGMVDYNHCLLKGRQAAGHCPKVMTSSEDSGLLTAGLLLSRHLPADIRERLMMA